MVAKNTDSAEIEYKRALFADKFDRKGPDECWPWLAGKYLKGNGYGIFNMGQLCASSKSKPAYVAAWFFYADPTFDLEAKTTFTHLCGDTLCVNPRHLAIYGALGLLNDESVLQFIASRHPKARKNLLSAMKNLSPKLLKKPTSGARKAIPR